MVRRLCKLQRASGRCREEKNNFPLQGIESRFIICLDLMSLKILDDGSKFCASVIPPYQLLNAWTNLYATRYVYHGIWAHLNGVRHKFLSSVCVSLCVSILSLKGNCSVNCIPPFGARQRLGKQVPAATNTRNSYERRFRGSVCVSPTVAR
jgi:hypothetical protein